MEGVTQLIKKIDIKILILALLAIFVACTYRNSLYTNIMHKDIYLSEGVSFKDHQPLEIKNIAGTIISRAEKNKYYPESDIFNPYNGTIFPIDMASPTVIWEDQYFHSTMWLITVSFENNNHAIYILTDQSRWTPDRNIWEIIKANSVEKKAFITILGINNKKSCEIITRSSITISTSKDKVGAPIFYQQIPLPFAKAKKHPELSEWRLGYVSSYETPPIVMEKLPVCGNCHSFSRDGKMLGMDMDYKKDKGAYVLTTVRENISISADDFITWNDFQRSEKSESMGLFSRISPDSKHVISTVKETSFFTMIPDLYFSQFFFPIKGLIACYSIKENKFFSLPGADDPDYVQTCPAWSPDGKYVVYARAGVNKNLLMVVGDKGYFNIEQGVRISDLNKKYKIRFDLYRIPFNGGKGGVPEPLIGASHNGKSNYFPRFSPDGKWIIFTRSETGLAIQPDSKLYIVPAEGGIARKLDCNMDIMNSWHSWSPNSRWLLFTSKINTPFTQIFLTHINENGEDSPPVLLSRFNSDRHACIVPEFVNLNHQGIKKIKLNDDLIY